MQVEVDADVPNPSNILIVPENVQVSDNATVEEVADADVDIPAVVIDSAEWKKNKNNSMKKKKKLIKD